MTGLKEGWSTVLAEHFQRYPHLQLQDVYKLLHQAVLGSGHAIRDAEQARRWLEEEASGPPLGGFESPLIEPVSPEGSMLRVHLRPYLACSTDLEPLLSGFIQTAAEMPGSLEGMKEVSLLAGEAAHLAGLPFLSVEVREYMNGMQAQNFPAVHHSKEYVRHYQPAYRVVAAKFIPAILAVCR
jgi:hypothetical protein